MCEFKKIDIRPVDDFLKESHINDLKSGKDLKFQYRKGVEKNPYGVDSLDRISEEIKIDQIGGIKYRILNDLENYLRPSLLRGEDIDAVCDVLVENYRIELSRISGVDLVACYKLARENGLANDINYDSKNGPGVRVYFSSEFNRFREKHHRRKEGELDKRLNDLQQIRERVWFADWEESYFSFNQRYNDVCYSNGGDTIAETVRVLDEIQFYSREGVNYKCFFSPNLYVDVIRLEGPNKFLWQNPSYNWDLTEKDTL